MNERSTRRGFASRPAVMADVMARVNLAGTGRTLLAPDGAGCRVGRGLDVVVDVAPGGLGGIELHGQLMHAHEAIGMKAAAVLLLPDDLLRDPQARISEAVRCRH